MIRKQKVKSVGQLSKANRGQSHRLLNPQSIINISYTIISHNALNISQHSKTQPHYILYSKSS